MAGRYGRAILFVALLLTLAALLISAAPAWAADGSYTVRRGDTLWGISQRTGVPVKTLVSVNHIANPDRVFPGQRLVLEAPPPGSSVRGAAARSLLVAAAREHGLNPSFVLAVSLWESGWNQASVSRDGAVGLMQILPLTAEWAGPALLRQPVDLGDARDNARLGAALLRRYLDEFGDPRLALAAYYQGERAAREHGIFPSSRRYVDGIWALRNQLQAAG